MWESININPIMSYLEKNKSDTNLIFADIVYFGLIYPPEKKRENSNRGKSCPPRFLYSLPTLGNVH